MRTRSVSVGLRTTTCVCHTSRILKEADEYIVIVYSMTSDMMVHAGDYHTTYYTPPIHNMQHDIMMIMII